MPESKNPKPSRARKTASKKPAARKATAKKSTAARKPAARKTTRDAAPRAPRKPAPQPDELLEQRDDAASEAPSERSRLARPVAIGVPADRGDPDAGPPSLGDPDGDLPPSPFDETPPPAPSLPGGSDLEDPRGELIVGVLALIAAVSVFLPWYESRSFLDTTVSGWASGTWGPVVFFASLAAVAIVALRRMGVALAFPVSSALVLEGIGWISVIGLVLKRLFTPTGVATTGPFEGGFWLAIVSTVGVALAAGRLSKDSPFVTIPGWFRSSAGKAGAMVLALALAGGAAFGVMNDVGSALRLGGSFGSTGGEGGPKPQLQKGLPDCVRDSGFPVIDGVTPEQGFGSDEGPQQVCTAVFSSDLSVRQIDKRYRAALKQAGWRFTVLDTPGGAAADNARMYSISEPECGTFQIIDTQNNRSVSLVLGPSFCRDLQGQPGSP